MTDLVKSLETTNEHPEIKPGQTVRVHVRIVDLQYGQGALPPNSFFERLTVELAAWTKEDQDAKGKVQPPDTSAAFGDTAELLNY